MEDISDLLYNDAEAKFLALQNKKKKRKKRRRRMQMMVVLVLLLVGGIYFSSDASKVKSIYVKGNLYYSDEEVLKKAGLSYNTRYIVMPKLYLEWKLGDDSLLKDVKVSKRSGAITLSVSEKTIIGYFVKKEKNYILLEDGTTKEISSDHLTVIADYPLVDGFSDDQLKNLGKSFAKENRIVDVDMIAMISEIHPYKASYDANMIKLIMRDGNAIYTDYASMPLLNDYKDAVLKNIKKGKKTKVCVVMDDATASLHTEDCSEFE